MHGKETRACEEKAPWEVVIGKQTLEVSLFIGGRRQIVQACLPSLTVVEDLDVLRDLPLCFLSCGVLAMVDQFVFQRPPEALDGGVVVAVATATHGSLHVELFKVVAVLQR